MRSVFEWSTRRTPNPAAKVRVPLWPLAGFVLGRPEFKSSATLANNKLVASCQLEFFLLCFIWFVSNYLSRVPVNKLNKLNTLSAINKLTIGTQFQGSLNSRFLRLWKNREIKIPRIKIPAKFNTHIEKSNQRKRNEQY